jgi:Ca-activated chloride channel family protein
MKALWLVVVCALPAAAAAATTEGRLVTRDRGLPVDMPLEHTDVDIHIDGYLADATVTQRFTNPFATKIEAAYVFPLPSNAAVTEMTITVGTRTIHGSIQERERAKRVYTAARDRGLVAALLTEERPNLFTQSIANLEPHATIEVRLRYVERLAYDAGGYELVFPMVAAPRTAPSDGIPAAAAETRPARDIGLTVELDAGVPIEDVRSPSHRVVIARPGGARADVHLAADDRVPNKDFVLRYQVAGRSPSLGTLAYKDGEAGSFVLIAQPPAANVQVAIAPRELVFVLDTSSSMRGAPLAKAKDLIRTVLARLRPDDTFQIVRFDDRASALGPGPIANKPRNIQLVLDWLSALDAGGGTEMTAGIDAALAIPHDPARLRVVAFLTDGYVGNEDQILAKVAAHAGEARLFSFGVGSAVNRYLLEEMAAHGRGAAQFVRPDEDTAAAVAAFEHRIAAPVLTDVHVDWGALAVTDVTPDPVPDLFLGQPLVIAGHYARGGKGRITVHARQDGRDVQLPLDVELPERDVARPAIATVWARQHIAELSRRLVRKDDAALVRDITQLSLAYHVLTPYTAFVAVDDARVTAGGAATPVTVPVLVPDAVAGIEPAPTSITYPFALSASGTGSGGMRAAEVTFPEVHIETPIVTGSLSAAIIRQYIRRRFEKVRYCYEKQLRSHPGLAGTVQTQLRISANGIVEFVTASGVDPEVSACVADVLRAVEFPRVPNGDPVIVTYPFVFQPSHRVELP